MAHVSGRISVKVLMAMLGIMSIHFIGTVCINSVCTHSEEKIKAKAMVFEVKTFHLLSKGLCQF